MRAARNFLFRVALGPRTAVTLASLLLLGLVSGCGEDSAGASAPKLKNVLPERARPGAMLVVWGSDLGAKGTVKLGGKPVETTVWSASRIELTLPKDTPIGPTQVTVETSGGQSGPVPLTIEPNAPSIESIKPSRGKIGDVVTITGKDFGKGGADRWVEFFGVKAKASSWSDTEIKFEVPVFEKVGSVRVCVGDQMSPGETFMLVRPKGLSVEPSTAAVGEILTVEGQDFTATRGKVLFGEKGEPAEILSWTDTKITMKAPKSDYGPTQFQVTNQNGVSVATNFTLLSPAIEGVITSTVPESRYAKLQMDRRDFPHVLFFEQVILLNAHYWWTGLAWAREGLPVPRPAGQKFMGAVGLFPDYFIDKASGTHLVSSYDIQRTQLVVGVRKEGEKDFKWSQPDPSSKNVGMTSSIRMGPGGLVYVAYLDYENKCLKLAFGKDGKWTVNIVDSNPMVGLSPSLVLDAQGIPHMAYLDYPAKDLKYARWNATVKKYDTETVDSSGDCGEFASLAIDAQGAPHIAYFQRGGKADHPDGLRYATRSGKGWRTQTLAAGPGLGFTPKLIIEATGRRLIGFLDKTASAYKIAVAAPGGEFKIQSFKVENLWAQDEPGQADMVVAQDGQPRTLFWLAKPHALCFMKFELAP